jgi:hypothetical protein
VPAGLCARHRATFALPSVLVGNPSSRKTFCRTHLGFAIYQFFFMEIVLSSKADKGVLIQLTQGENENDPNKIQT